MPQVLSAHQQNKIAKFKYCGGDSSPVYAYVLSPLAQSLVDITPPWVPPNVITFMGLVFSIFSLVLTMYYNPELDKTSCPNWVHLVVAINLFLYQTLDNMDGKQARKTGSSSPLGMLFDHGIDAINSCLLVLPLTSAMGTGLNMYVVAAMLIVLLPFYTTTWEEFYREEMVLGYINGPTEGLLTLMAFLVCTSYYGTESWHEPASVPLIGQYLVPAGSTTFDLLVAVFGIMVFGTVVPQLYTGERHDPLW
jgi:ethanolaminephosphotransferase